MRVERRLRKKVHHRKLNQSKREEEVMKVVLQNPHSPSSSSSSSSEGSKHSSHKNNLSKKSDHNLSLLKLDVKFELPTYDGELNAEKLDNWIKKIEVYCRAQKIMDDTGKNTTSYYSTKWHNLNVVEE
jgi:hypothetical protein